MRIAVIGAGNVGKALAASFTRAGHEVTVSASSPESAERKAQDVAAEPASSNREAAAAADVIVLAVWYSHHETAAHEIADVVNGKIVVDVSNPLTPNMDGLATEGGPSAAERLGQLLPRSTRREGVQHRLRDGAGRPGRPRHRRRRLRVSWRRSATLESRSTPRTAGVGTRSGSWLGAPIPEPSAQ